MWHLRAADKLDRQAGRGTPGLEYRTTDRRVVAHYYNEVPGEFSSGKEHIAREVYMFVRACGKTFVEQAFSRRAEIP